MNFPDRPGSNSFLKLKDQEEVQGVLRGEAPYMFEQHWVDGKSSVCPGRHECEICARVATMSKEDAKKARAKPRFRVNLIIKENGVYVSKILEQSDKVLQDIKFVDSSMKKAGMLIEENLISIKREGLGLKTEYRVSAVLNGTLKPDELQKVAAVPLLELEHKQAEEVVPF